MNKELLNRVVDVYKKYLGDKLKSIILFGSQARGEVKEESDYDIFIIASDLPKSALERSRFIHKPMYENGLLSLSILAKTPEEFQKDVASLYLDLSLDGVILFDRNFVQPKLVRLKEIIQFSGLSRVKDNDEYHWEWEKYPKGEWEITLELIGKNINIFESLGPKEHLLSGYDDDVNLELPWDVITQNDAHYAIDNARKCFEVSAKIYKEFYHEEFNA